MQNIKIAIIGCGYWGKNLVRNFAALGVLDSVCDINPQAAAAVSAEFGVPALSLEQVLNRPVAGIVVATPPKQHFAVALQALLAGKHVFVEKPLTLDIEESKKLSEVAQRNKCVLMVGHLLQYHPAFIKLKAIILEGQLGRLQYLYSNRLNLGKFSQEENSLWNFGPHDISMILSLVQSLPKSVYASGLCHLTPDVHDFALMQLAFTNDIQAHVFVSWLHPYKEQRLIVVGDKGMAVFDDCLSWDEKLRLYPDQVQWINGAPQPEKTAAVKIALAEAEPLQLECQHFIDCIKNHTQPSTDAHEAIRVARVLVAAQESLSSKKIIALNPASQYIAHETALADMFVR